MAYSSAGEHFEETDQRFDDVHRRIDDLREIAMVRLTDLRSDMTANLVQVQEELRQLRTLLQNALRVRSA